MSKNDNNIVNEEEALDTSKIIPGSHVTITAAPVFPIHDSKFPSLYLTGEYYIFDDKIRNNRIRLCDSLNKVGKSCMRLGWFNISDLIFE